MKECGEEKPTPIQLMEQTTTNKKQNKPLHKGGKDQPSRLEVEQ